mgnify:CR=1 FL=1
MTLANVLCVDDEIEVLEALTRVFRKSDFKVFTANSGAEGLEMLRQERIDIVISDLKMPEMDGNQFLRKVANTSPEVMRLMLTAFTEIDDVITAINEGRIFGYLQKPWNNRELLLVVEQAYKFKSLMSERSMLKQVVDRYQQYYKPKFEGFVGDSMAMQFVYQAIEQAAPSSASIFVTGESGTGKEVAAAAIHHLSKRSNQPFIALNCAAIPSELMESEIFGHIKGAFSGAVSNRDGAATLADGGTLFLDELGEMDINLQAKLLRFIQTGEFQKVGSSKSERVDIRFVCATNRNPIEAIQKQQLREDLYYRLNVISIDIPPLRERDSDMVQLAHHFLGQFNEIEDKSIAGFTAEAEQLIKAYPWPGNVRQLQNTIHSAVILSQSNLIEAEVLKRQLKITNMSNMAVTSTSQPAPVNSMPVETPLDMPAQGDTIVPLAQLERQAIERAIQQCEENVVQAASLLGVSPSTLYRKIQQWQN